MATDLEDDDWLPASEVEDLLERLKTRLVKSHGAGKRDRVLVLYGAARVLSDLLGYEDDGLDELLDSVNGGQRGLSEFLK